MKTLLFLIAAFSLSFSAQAQEVIEEFYRSAKGNYHYFIRPGEGGKRELEIKRQLPYEHRPEAMVTVYKAPLTWKKEGEKLVLKFHFSKLNKDDSTWHNDLAQYEEYVFDYTTKKINYAQKGATMKAKGKSAMDMESFRMQEFDPEAFQPPVAAITATNDFIGRYEENLFAYSDFLADGHFSGSFRYRGKDFLYDVRNNFLRPGELSLTVREQQRGAGDIVTGREIYSTAFKIVDDVPKTGILHLQIHYAEKIQRNAKYLWNTYKQEHFAAKFNFKVGQVRYAEEGDRMKSAADSQNMPAGKLQKSFDPKTFFARDAARIMVEQFLKRYHKAFDL